MSNKFILFIIIFSLAVAPLAGAQDEAIPELSKEDIIQLLLFEISDLDKNAFVIDSIIVLGELARARLLLKNTDFELRLRCLKTDFGPRWRIADDSLKQIKSLLLGLAGKEENVPSTVNNNRPKENIEPPENTDAGQSSEEIKPDRTYRAFIEEFITVLHNGKAEKFELFFFRDDDLNIVGSDQPVEDARSQVKLQREQFLSQCEILSKRLSRFEECAVVSVVVNEVPAWVLEEVRELMPGASLYYNSATVEILLDGELGSLTLEALTLTNGSWRFGMIARRSLPTLNK